MASSSKRSWTAIILTTRTPKEADAVAQELATYQKKGYIAAETILLTIADPGAGVGSGGATINALLYTVEHICARRGCQVLSLDVLANSDILIIHHGRPYPFGCSSRAFTLLPRDVLSTGFSELPTNVLHLLDFVGEHLVSHFEHGVWVCSSDMLMRYDPKTETLLEPSATQRKHDACIITVSATPEYASRHGIVVRDHKGFPGFVSNILYAAPESEVRKHMIDNETVALVSGIVFLSASVSEQLLALLVSPALESCTYIGHDTGAQPTPVSLFFDILLAMCNQVTESDFMERSSIVSRADSIAAGVAGRETARKVRRLIWDNMRRFSLTAVHVPNVQHLYLSLDLCYREHELALGAFGGPNIAHSVLLLNHGDVSPKSRCINSYFSSRGPSASLGEVSLVNCYITPDLALEPPSAVCNVDTRMEYFGDQPLTLKTELCLQTFQVNLATKGLNSVHVPVVFGMTDVLMGKFSATTSTYCNIPWPDFMMSSQINETDLWPSSTGMKTLWNAKLFPVLTDSGEPTLDTLFWAFHPARQHRLRSGYPEVDKWRSSWRFSFDDIFKAIDVAAEFASRRALFNDVLGEILRQKLLHSEDFNFLPYFRSAAADGFAQQLLTVLDDVAPLSSHGVTARALALIADLLGSMAGGRGGLRSGPAANEAFAAAYRAFDNEDMVGGIALMAKERKKWIGRPDLLIRCARHYEGAAQICIRKAVASAKKFISVSRSETAEKPSGKHDTWWVAECPARIDLSGGWTDTPPICYEHGGLVINAALLINGKRPIGAKVRRTANFSVVLIGDNDSRLELLETSDLSDYCIPNAPGALLKTCLIFANVLDPQLPQSLSEQLQSKWGSGFEIVSWSNLPQGSGLGTSSILAAAVVAALWSALGMKFDNEAVVHAVLCVEQMLTTGGGWQDQVGGVFGGIKAASSAAKLPLQVQTEKLNITPENLEEFSSRIVLIYTGKPRLAKNLLQNVVRNWYAREESVVSTCTNLKSTAEKCRDSLQNWSFDNIRSCITEYYEQKKLMAAGTEPVSVRELIAALTPYISGHTLAGAGGGGFFFCLLKNPEDREEVEKLVPSVKGAHGSVVFGAAIDVSGMKLTTLPVTA
ncbi:L-fucose kinase [Hypsibius exemplaris]|uniref:L-fucose kinase n=1 Tax=Hypsibius exemplaris TaxID=2072580 RepID=A0A1W0X1Z7_HYPEX|nr:L-fucose kinase [Hypsibius exemplaris]